MKAFAKAANVSYEKVLLSNCFYDLYVRFSCRKLGCRQAAVWGKKTADGTLLHARNLDWPDWGTALRNNNIFLLRRYPKENAIVTLTWPGFFGCLTGCNDKGLVIAYNMLTQSSEAEVHEPIFFILKRVLRKCSNLKEALALIQKTPMDTDGSMMISSTTEKNAIVIDVRNKKILVRNPLSTDSFLVNDNTCYFDSVGKLCEDKYKKSSFYQVVEGTEAIDIKKAQSVMANAKVLQSINILTAVFCPEKDRLYLAYGRYEAAQGPYEEIRLFEK
jgi:predicted choloylglycine hydrolase